MSFSVEQALTIAMANLAQRAKTRSTAYTLYFTNDQKRYDGKIDGLTIKALIDEFRTTKANFKYAFITKKNDDTLLRFYNRDVSKKFFSMTRKGRKSK